MAKKTVASVKKTGEGKNFIKAIRMVKSQKSGAYTFVEKIVYVDNIKKYFENKEITSR